MPWPMPFVPPVTIATFCVKSIANTAAVSDMLQLVVVPDVLLEALIKCLRRVASRMNVARRFNAGIRLANGFASHSDD